MRSATASASTAPSASGSSATASSSASAALSSAAMAGLGIGTGTDPLSQTTSALLSDLHELKAMGLDLSSLLQEPKKSQAEQSRLNGRKSKGPVTPEGKAASSQNALKHGIYANGILLPGEDPAAFDAFASGLSEEFKPSGVLQEMLVERTAQIGWKLRRLPAVEAAILESARLRHEREMEEEDEAFEVAGSPGGIGDLLHQLVGKEEDGILLRLQRYEVRLERSME